MHWNRSEKRSRHLDFTLEDNVNEAHFGRIFSIKVGSHVKKLDGEAKMNEWLATVRHTRLSLSIYKYGNDVATKDQLNEFTAAFVAPPNQDRSGAPNEETIQQYIGKLHERWASTWEADGPVWRIWANYIVKQPRLVWDSRVQLTPPPHVLARLRPKTSNQEAHTQNFRQTIRTARDVIDGSLRNWSAAWSR
ncbi:hypothetical protein AeMF1_013031 [Aphanomyces euteiches]|nr:hypothetical protein AeMF1_013031 [Aphanomyces euteiches]